MVARLQLVVMLSLAILLGGCVGGVKLRHPSSGKEVSCGPYALKFGIGYQELDRCLNDYQVQGYVRVPD